MDFKTMSKAGKRQMEQIFHFETNGGPKKHIRSSGKKTVVTRSDKRLLPSSIR
jgi:hypothetical protein